MRKIVLLSQEPSLAITEASKMGHRWGGSGRKAPQAGEQCSHSPHGSWAPAPSSQQSGNSPSLFLPYNTHVFKLVFPFQALFVGVIKGWKCTNGPDSRLFFFQRVTSLENREGEICRPFVSQELRFKKINQTLML